MEFCSPQSAFQTRNLVKEDNVGLFVLRASGFIRLHLEPHQLEMSA